MTGKLKLRQDKKKIKIYDQTITLRLEPRVLNTSKNKIHDHDMTAQVPFIWD